jgi:hypothetical protein
MDNFFKNCPPKMEDGRHLTDYRTATRREEYIKYVNNVVRNDDYRLLLQQNASKFMDAEWEYTKQTSSCWTNDCIHNYPTRVYPPWFVEERLRHDSLQDPNKKHIYRCAEKNDYRLNSDGGNVTEKVKKDKNKK